MQLDDKQLEAVSAAIGSLKPSNYYRIGGYAGTGKTTVAKTIIDTANMRIKVCAFAGKAAHVLRKKGVNHAETIHKIIYAWDDRLEVFNLRPSLGCDAILVDEGSMVPLPLWHDLVSYNLPIIVVGDPGQLEPIGDDAHLMRNPDIVLDTIHRYAGTIAWFANEVRQHGHVPWIQTDTVTVKSKADLMGDMSSLLEATFLCGFNKTRVAINKEIMRRLNNRRREPILFGEKLICLHNDRKLGVFNGMFLTVTRIHEQNDTSTLADIVTDSGDTKCNVLLWHGHLHKSEQIDWRQYPKKHIIVDYGYCITVHKFQGSEDDHVVVIDEEAKWDQTRWRYTAFTRAAKTLRVYI